MYSYLLLQVKLQYQRLRSRIRRLNIKHYLSPSRIRNRYCLASDIQLTSFFKIYRQVVLVTTSFLHFQHDR